VLAQCAYAQTTIFKGIEDVEISPIDQKIYLAVKGKDRVYRFTDGDPISGTVISNFEIYVGGTSYEINDGTNSFFEPWGTGNDNLAFDDLGNLWVLQDGDDNHIWVVENGHSQQVPQVKIFARTPSGGEPTGITFTPDYRYLFMSIQHPDQNNDITNQLDAFGEPRNFNKDVALVISRNEYSNNPITGVSDLYDSNKYLQLYPNPANKTITIAMNKAAVIGELQLLDSNGKRIPISIFGKHPKIQLTTDQLPAGIYHLRALINKNYWMTEKLVISK